MSEPTPLDALEAQVRQAIEPIPASARRKRAMGEELLAHLIGAYEQEFEATGCIQTAMDMARSRFGNVEIVREELRQSVPLAERLIYFLLSPREQLMLRWILVGIALTTMGIGIVLPALAQIKSGATLHMGGAIALSIGVALVVLGMTTIGLKLARR